jgi:signal transduction histidine kinase
MKFGGIRNRILAIALLPAVMMAVVLGIWSGAAQRHQQRAALQDRAHLITAQLAEASKYPVYANEVLILQELIASTLARSDVLGVSVRDRSGRLLAQQWKGTQASGRVCDRDAHPPCFTAKIDGSPALARRYSAAGDGSIGTVSVQMATVKFGSGGYPIWLWGLGSAGLCLGLGALAARHIGSQVVRPIADMARAVERIGKGDFNVRLDNGAGGELSILQQGVNDMTAKLKQGQEMLEQRIEEATRLLTAQKEEAERANLAKSRFLAAATHDLRQPMHALVLFVAALKERIHYPEVSRIVHSIELSVTAMQGMFNALLDISRLDAGVLHAHPRDFYLQALFDRLLPDFTPHAVEKQIRFRVVPTQTIVRTDPVLLERILMNLISNGIRYTSEGGVVVGCRRSKGGVRIEVWDSGAGIPRHRQKEIFQEFVQLNNPERDRNKGLGLGLAIALRMARLLGSQIEIKSIEGRGSVFSIRVPRGNAKRVADEAAPPVATRRRQLKDTLVVFVDDEAAILEGMEVLLRDWGCQPIIAATAVGALAGLAGASRPPDIIVSDYRLRQRENGIDLIAQIRERYSAAIPGILVSGDTGPELLREAKDRGLHILHKPMRPAKLRALIDHLVNSKTEST